ncbi:MAG: hypothetical protein ABIS50_05115 [Luteolibacter sp.]|uniref:hypothetical protein n=1 Tax=Luteolibacter sp. TaxID=1962973 RepID=UPI0032673827
MSSPNPDDSLLLIRCPSCGQRFKVGEDLRERTVECGGCEHRFRINDEVIVRSRKVYPGERHNSGLNRFQRVPLAGGEKMIGMEPVRYGGVPDPALLEPVSPLRIITGIAGATGIVLMALVLMFGNSRGGILDGMEMGNRLVMGGFAAVMGILMLGYANPKAKVKAMSVGLLMSAGMMAIPFFFDTGSQDLSKRNGKTAETVEPSTTSEVSESSDEKMLSALRNRIGTGPLDTEIERLAKEGSSKRAVGLWLRGMSDPNRFLVRDYILRVTDADPSSHFYPRDGGDFLMVVTGITCTLQELSGYAAMLGQTEKIYPELSVIEVRVRNENFVEGSMDKLSDKNDPAFYDLNKRELESIDLKRVERAVQRLSEAEPKIYRTDIARKLIDLLGEDGVTFKAPVCRALTVWSEQPGLAGEAALVEVKKRMATKQEIPKEMVALIVKEKNTAVVPILNELWLKNPMIWESIYGDVGPAAEASVVRSLPETEGTVRYSAVRILGRVGGTDSLPVLKAVGAATDPELKVLVEQASKSILARAGQ